MRPTAKIIRPKNITEEEKEKVFKEIAIAVNNIAYSLGMPRNREFIVKEKKKD